MRGNSIYSKRTLILRSPLTKTLPIRLPIWASPTISFCRKSLMLDLIIKPRAPNAGLTQKSESQLGILSDCSFLLETRFLQSAFAELTLGGSARDTCTHLTFCPEFLPAALAGDPLEILRNRSRFAPDRRQPCN